MLHAPVSENKTPDKQSKTQSEPESERRALGWAGHPALGLGGENGSSGGNERAQGWQPINLSTLSQGGILQRKCACGSSAGAAGTCRACQSKEGGMLQTKLSIGASDDRYEREADRVADEVMRMPESTIQPNVGSEQKGSIQRKAISNSITPLQRSSTAPNQSAEVPEIVDQVLRSPGQPLDSATRALMEPRFGRDFSQVRVHTGEDAARSALDVNARAYTVRNNVVFGAGQFAPGTDEGRRLIAHELTHVIQQGMGSYQLQRWENCNPGTLSIKDCPPRELKETEFAHNGLMFFSPGLKDSITKSEGVLISNFDIGSAAIKRNLHNSIEWKQFLEKISVNRSQWKLLGFTDCQGSEGQNQKLREDRAATVFDILPSEIKSQIVLHKSAPIHECITDNRNSAARIFNRSVAFILETSFVDMEAEQITVCIPPKAQKSPGKRCIFYVFDGEEPKLGGVWEASARGMAAISLSSYAIPAGKNIEIMLHNILETYANEDCGCTDEIQFWSHGSPGNGMYINGGGEFTVASFNISGLDKFGDGPTSMPGYKEWSEKLSVEQRRLVLLRRTICDPDSEVYYRSCQAFQGKEGQEFAKDSALFWRSKVVGHTKLIGISQPGKKVLKPCQEPYWLTTEGENEESKKDKDKLRHIKPR